jgi:hypothetical protein
MLFGYFQGRDVEPLSGSFLWLLMAFLVTIWYASSVLEILMFSLNRLTTESYQHHNVAGYYVGFGLLTRAVVAQIGRVVIILVAVAALGRLVGLWGSYLELTDAIGLILGVLWIPVLSIQLREIREVLRHPY